MKNCWFLWALLTFSATNILSQETGQKIEQELKHQAMHSTMEELDQELDDLQKELGLIQAAEEQQKLALDKKEHREYKNSILTRLKDVLEEELEITTQLRNEMINRIKGIDIEDLPKDLIVTYEQGITDLDNEMASLRQKIANMGKVEDEQVMQEEENIYHED